MVFKCGQVGNLLLAVRESKGLLGLEPKAGLDLTRGGSGGRNVGLRQLSRIRLLFFHQRIF